MKEFGEKMSEKNKKNTVVTIILIIILILLILIINKSRNNNVNRSYNVSNTTASERETIENLNKVATKKSNGIYEIYNTDIKTNTGSTKITATIKNISSNKTVRQRVEITLLDKNGNEVGTIITTIPSLEVNGTTEISAEDLKVYENVYDFKIK